MPEAATGDRPPTSPRHLARPFRRSSDDQVIAGVCGGLAARLDVGTTLVRVIAVVTIALGGAGLLAYMAVWVLVPAAGEEESIGGRVMADRRELQIVLAFTTALVAVLIATRAFGLHGFGVPTLSLMVAAVGALVVWRGASREESARLRDRLNAAPGFGSPASKSWWRMALRAGVGIVLILIGVGELSRMGNLQGAAFGVLMGAVLFAGGFLVLFAPWWARTLRDLSTERRERVRAQERADMAAHVHDSVLQTLSLIQKSAGDPREVVRLARIEERELRHWLFDPARLGRRGDEPETFADAVGAIEREVEDSYGVGVELIVVGDCADGRRGGRPGRCLPRGHRQRRQVVGLHGGVRLRRGRAGHRVGLRAGSRHRLRPGARARRPPGHRPVDGRAHGTPRRVASPSPVHRARAPRWSWCYPATRRDR